MKLQVVFGFVPKILGKGDQAKVRLNHYIRVVVRERERERERERVRYRTKRILSFQLNSSLLCLGWIFESN